MPPEKTFPVLLKSLELTTQTGEGRAEHSSALAGLIAEKRVVGVLIPQFDSFATAAGSIDLQTSTAAPAGGYAFNLGGYDGSNPMLNLAVGGILNISGASISPAGSVLDYNDGGTVKQALTIASGTVSAPDALGRVVITVNSSSGLPSVAVAGYTVGTNQIQLVETNDTLSGDLGGMALGQGSNTGAFNQASVSGASYAYAAEGQDNPTA